MVTLVGARKIVCCVNWHLLVPVLYLGKLWNFFCSKMKNNDCLISVNWMLCSSSFSRLVRGGNVAGGYCWHQFTDLGPGGRKNANPDSLGLFNNCYIYPWYCTDAWCAVAADQCHAVGSAEAFPHHLQPPGAAVELAGVTLPSSEQVLPGEQGDVDKLTIIILWPIHQSLGPI